MYNNKNFLRNEQHFFDDFEFVNGQVLENARVSYGFIGTPKYDEDGNITNAILFCHNFQGDYSTITDFGPLTGENKVFNKDDYFFISITSLGFHGSVCPSDSGLKRDFPEYSIDDLVNFQRRLLREKFPNIKKLKGIFGYSLGGYIALSWAINFPDEMDFIIHMKSSYKVQGYKYVYAKLSNEIIESSQQYESELYDKSSSKDLILVSQIHYLMNFSIDHICKMSNDDIDFSIENLMEEILFYDIFDIKACNDFILTVNLEEDLDKIKCKTLIIGVNNTNYYVPEYDSIPIHEAIKHSEYILLDVDKPNDLDYLNKIEVDIKRFVDSV